jgi:hypothetical protein
VVGRGEGGLELWGGKLDGTLGEEDVWKILENFIPVHPSPYRVRGVTAIPGCKLLVVYQVAGQGFSAVILYTNKKSNTTESFLGNLKSNTTESFSRNFQTVATGFTEVRHVQCLKYGKISHITIFGKNGDEHLCVVGNYETPLETSGISKTPLETSVISKTPPETSVISKTPPETSVISKTPLETSVFVEASEGYSDSDSGPSVIFIKKTHSKRVEKIESMPIRGKTPLETSVVLTSSPPKTSVVLADFTDFCAVLGERVHCDLNLVFEKLKTEKGKQVDLRRIIR